MPRYSYLAILLCLAVLSQAKPNLGFLESNNVVVAKEELAANSLPKDAFELFSGFIHGEGILENVDFKNCTIIDAELENDIQSIIMTLKNLTYHNIEDSVSSLVKEFQTVVKKVKSNVKACTPVEKELVTYFQKLHAYVSEKGFAQTVLFNFLGHLQDFENEGKEAVALLTNKQFYQAGVKFGDLVKKAVLFNFKPKAAMLAYISINYKELFNCVKKSGVNFFKIAKIAKKVIQILKEKKDLNKILEEIGDTVENGEEIVKNCKHVFK